MIWALNPTGPNCLSSTYFGNHFEITKVEGIRGGRTQPSYVGHRAYLFLCGYMVIHHPGSQSPGNNLPQKGKAESLHIGGYLFEKPRNKI